jgi:hypothetical protein
MRAYKNWAPIMLDMAAHIGPYATLLLVDAFAGQQVYVSSNPARSPFAEIIGADKRPFLPMSMGVNSCRSRGRRERFAPAVRALLRRCGKNA